MFVDRISLHQKMSHEAGRGRGSRFQAPPTCRTIHPRPERATRRPLGVLARRPLGTRGRRWPANVGRRRRRQSTKAKCEMRVLWPSSDARTHTHTHGAGCCGAAAVLLAGVRNADAAATRWPKVDTHTHITTWQHCRQGAAFPICSWLKMTSLKPENQSKHDIRFPFSVVHPCHITHTPMYTPRGCHSPSKRDRK